MYHHIMSKRMDMICMMTKLATTFPVTSAITTKALFLLAQRHPLLRMTIQSKKDSPSGYISFLEMDDVQLDFLVSEREDWLPFILEEVGKPFDIKNGPLWKCRLLGQTYGKGQQLRNTKQQTDLSANLHQTVEPQNEYPYESTFLFILHHSIMDGGYILRVFKEFAELLDRVNSGTNVSLGISEILPLLPPVEDILVCPFPQRQTAECAGLKSSSSVRLVLSNASYDTLRDYNQKFSYEIQDKGSHSLDNRCLVFEFTEQETSIIDHLCKQQETSTNGLFLAASILAFIDLVYPASARKIFDIPFEYMMDLRRHYHLDFPRHLMKYYPGVASMHIPMTADMRLMSRPVAKQEFWEMSRSFGNSINNQIKSPKTFQRMHETIKETMKLQQAETPTGKSPHVLCLSNMGRLDNVFTGDVATRLKLTGLHGHPTVLNENCPIFFVGIHSLNGKICGNVSYCENYTSSRTASQYVGHFQKHISSLTKL